MIDAPVPVLMPAIKAPPARAALVPMTPAAPASPGIFAAVVAAFSGPIFRRFVPQFVETEAEFNEPWTEARDLPHFVAPPAPPPQLQSTLGFTLQAEAVPADSAEGRAVAAANAAARARHAAAVAGDAVVITEYEEWSAEVITGSVSVSERQTVAATAATLVVEPAAALGAPPEPPSVPVPSPRMAPAPRVPAALNASIRRAGVAGVASAPSASAPAAPNRSRPPSPALAPLAPLAPSAALRRGVRSSTPTPPAPPATAAAGFAADVAGVAIHRAFVPQFVETDAEFNESWHGARELPHFAAAPAAPLQLRSTLGFTLPAEATPARPGAARAVAAAPAGADDDGDVVMVEEWGAELVTTSVRAHVEETTTIARLRSVDGAGRSTTIAAASSFSQNLAFEQRQENASFTVRCGSVRRGWLSS